MDSGATLQAEGKLSPKVLGQVQTVGQSLLRTVRVFPDTSPHSKMLLIFTHLLRLKREHACGPKTFLSGVDCLLPLLP
jgi:hypothetical protein